VRLLDRIVLVWIALTACVMLAWLVAPSAPAQRVYDCSLAEFHLDYPSKVREACREMMKDRKVNWI